MLFVGAGASVAAGLPTWATLVETLASKLDPPVSEEELAAADLLAIPQYYKNQRGKDGLSKWLREQIQVPNQGHGVSTAIHDAICRIPGDLIYTTNFDNLIEERLKAARRNPHVVASEDAVRYFSDEPHRHEVVVRKIHGTIEHPYDVVLSREDFARFRIERPNTIATLAEHLKSHHFLFVGYSLRDPDLSSVYDYVFYQKREAHRKHFICLDKVTKHEHDDLEERGLRPIVLSDWGSTKSEQLLNFLTKLADDTTARHHVLRFFPIKAHDTVPIVVTSTETDEKCFNVAAADMATAHQIAKDLRDIDVAPEIVPAIEFVSQIERYRHGDIVLICSPLGNIATRQILRGMEQQGNPLSKVNYTFVAARLEGPGGFSVTSDSLPLTPDGKEIVRDNKERREYALVARYVNPWSDAELPSGTALSAEPRNRRFIFLFAGIRALGTELVGKFLGMPHAYLELLQSSDAASPFERVVEIRYNTYNPLNFEWSKPPKVLDTPPPSGPS